MSEGESYQDTRPPFCRYFRLSGPDSGLNTLLPASMHDVFDADSFPLAAWLLLLRRRRAIGGLWVAVSYALPLYWSSTVGRSIFADKRPAPAGDTVWPTFLLHAGHVPRQIHKTEQDPPCARSASESQRGLTGFKPGWRSNMTEGSRTKDETSSAFWVT